MLNFERVVKAEDGEMAVYVFVDEEKGHTVYLSPTGMMNVVKDEGKKNGQIRAAGFLINDQNDCASCGGC